MSASSFRALAALAVLIVAGAGALMTAPGSAATAAARATTLTSSLAGAGNGDIDGAGFATLRLMARRGDVCATVSWRNIQRPTAAHIHRASDGAVMVDLSGALSDGSGCNTSVSGTVIRAINANPRAYYVNVHNAPYPGGAIKGTLRR